MSDSGKLFGQARIDSEREDAAELRRLGNELALRKSAQVRLRDRVNEQQTRIAELENELRRHVAREHFVRTGEGCGCKDYGDEYDRSGCEIHGDTKESGDSVDRLTAENEQQQARIKAMEKKLGVSQAWVKNWKGSSFRISELLKIAVMKNVKQQTRIAELEKETSRLQSLVNETSNFSP